MDAKLGEDRVVPLVHQLKLLLAAELAAQRRLPFLQRHVRGLVLAGERRLLGLPPLLLLAGLLRFCGGERHRRSTPNESACSYPRQARGQRGRVPALLLSRASARTTRLAPPTAVWRAFFRSYPAETQAAVHDAAASCGAVKHALRCDPPHCDPVCVRRPGRYNRLPSACGSVAPRRPVFTSYRYAMTSMNKTLLGVALLIGASTLAGPAMAADAPPASRPVRPAPRRATPPRRVLSPLRNCLMARSPRPTRTATSSSAPPIRRRRR